MLLEDRYFTGEEGSTLKKMERFRRWSGLRTSLAAVFLCTLRVLLTVAKGQLGPRTRRTLGELCSVEEEEEEEFIRIQRIL